MQQVIYQDGNKIEFFLSDNMTEEDFRQLIHQLESLCTMHTDINVLIDAGSLKNINLTTMLEQFDFYKKYKKSLNRLALVSEGKIERFLMEQFNKFSDTEIKTFPGTKIEEARKWIFPSRLP